MTIGLPVIMNIFDLNVLKMPAGAVLCFIHAHRSIAQISEYVSFQI